MTEAQLIRAIVREHRYLDETATESAIFQAVTEMQTVEYWFNGKSWYTMDRPDKDFLIRKHDTWRPKRRRWYASMLRERDWEGYLY